jgi:hypothetical protein
MTTDPNAVAALTSELCTALERLETALVRLDTDALLSTEETLGRLVAALASVDSVPVGDRQGLVATIRRGQDVLMRCRRLGASLAAVARARLTMLGGGEAYDRGGDLRQKTIVGSAVKVAV